MQAAAFRAAGLDDWSYEIREVDAAGLPAAVADLRRDVTCAGANVTIPHKVAVMPLLDATDAVARAVGAVNTIVRDHDHLAGHNTDVAGIAAAAGDAGYHGGDVVVLGAGGSARAVEMALSGQPVSWVAREPDRAAGLEPVYRWDDPAWYGHLDAAALLINATPLGRHGELPVDPRRLPRDAGVVDLVYVEGGTPLVRAAREQGLRVADGWTVLLEQGAAAFELWTGRAAPRDAMRAVLPA